jgi:CBF1 interacting corepressor
MVQGLAFLSKKGFNPQNQDNRKRVWEAQQASKQEKERLRNRQKQLKREKEEEELERVTKGEIGGSQAQLRFMYDAPPGMNKESKTDKVLEERKSLAFSANRNQDTSASIENLTQANSGDDAAAASFRRMLAASVQNTVSSQVDNNEQGSNDSEPSFKFAPVLQGTTVEAQGGDVSKGRGGTYDGRSTLEKAVGRKDRSSQNLSYQQQIERFPQLKNAPIVHSMKKATGDGDEQRAEQPMMVNFKPLGAQILHVRCLACGVWGHQRGDRECAKSGWNPFALPSKSQTVAADPSVPGASTVLQTISDIRHPSGDSKHSGKSRRNRQRSDNSDSSSEWKSHRRYSRRSSKHEKRNHGVRKRNIDEESSNSDRSNVIEDTRNIKQKKDRYSAYGSEDERSYQDRKRRPTSSRKKRRKHDHKESSRHKK